MPPHFFCSKRVLNQKQKGRWRVICARGAYFGTYHVDSEQGTLRTLLVGALSEGSVGADLRAKISIDCDLMTLELDTATPAGEPVHRTLIWNRVG